VDGCNRVGVLRHIVVPLAAPGLAATSVFAFLLGWNEFLFSLILTSSSATRTLPVVVAGFVTDRGVAWGEMSAGGVLIALPVIIFALLVQKYIVRGLGGAVGPEQARLGQGARIPPVGERSQHKRCLAWPRPGRQVGRG